MNRNKTKIDFLFETSWEVCNKVGGIYTVLSTKAKNLQTLYKDKVVFVGPDVWSETNRCPVFKESKTIFRKWLADTVLPFGITVRIGRWEVPGRPIAVLVGFDGLFEHLNGIYGEMWRDFGVDSLHAYGDYSEACAFSIASAIVMKSLYNFLGFNESSRVIAHFNEWTTGMGLLYVKKNIPAVATVFTTHATSIGRSICGNGKELYRYFRGYDGDIMARELNMEAKHSLEKAAAHNADCFTTVSEITADECEQLLDRRPDVVTPNGFEENFVPADAKFNAKRRKARKLLLKAANALTGAALDDDTFVVITSGRCEYRNKGLDLFIDSMNRLSELDVSRRILAFVMVPAWVRSPRTDLQHNMSLNENTALNEPVITHNLHNPDTDAVLGHIRRLGFDNKRGSRCVMIYVPCYLNGDDGIFNTSYYDLLVGADATVFPSYYEPWGYTPLESIAFGVPTVTTSLSGFGRWILSNFDNSLFDTGVYVARRDDTNYGSVCNDIAGNISRLASAGADLRQSASAAARRTAGAAAWDYFIEYYVNTFDLALENARKRIKQSEIRNK